MQSILLNDVLFLNWTVADCVFYFINSAALFTLILCSVISFLYLRPKLPSRVNCWFCNRSFWVPYPHRNCFDCRYCDQYNGFADDGDYNTDVLSRKGGTVELKMTQTDPVNGLCKSCNLNQQLKVLQLAKFVPMNENNYDEEVEHFQNQLEKSYKLCDGCALILTQTLQTQHYGFLEKRLNGHCPNGTPSSPKGVITRYRARKACRVGSTSCLVLLLLLAVYELAREAKIIPEFLQVEGFWCATKISTVGAVLSLVEALYQKFSPKTCLNLSSWGVVHCLSWTNDYVLWAVSSSIVLLIDFWPKKVEMKKLRVEKIQPIQTDSIAQAVKAAVASTKTVPVPRKVEKITPPRMETRSQSRKVSPQQNPRSRLFSPPPEVYDRFNNMRLSSPEPEPRPKTPNVIKPAKLTLGAKRTPSPPLQNCFSPSDTLSDLNLFTPYHIDYDYGPCSPGYFAPVTHAAYSYSFRPAPYGYPNARFSPPFASPYDSTNSSHISDSLQNSQNNQVWEWIKRCFCVTSVVLNVIAMVFFFDEVRRRMF